ncbi:MAG TPA: HAD-IA family hydrolase [Bacteroidota bacterium]|nr:HAD-IA family hydrolase [Bacteroidota bacterium]
MRELVVPGHIRGLIFDCDGTLVDSMPLHMRAWEHSVTTQGGRWDLDFFFSKKGVPDKAIVAGYNAEFGYHLDLAKTTALKDDFFRSRGDQLAPVSCVVDIAKHYHGILPEAVASGGTRANIDFQLNALGIASLFDVIVSADDGIPPKPNPDIFLEAARRLGVAPTLCQVFEDAEIGLEGARRAGMLATDVR